MVAECLRRVTRGFCMLALASLVAFVGATFPVRADEGLQIIRDTETERLLRGYLDPILRAAGLQPAAVHLYLINDPSINAFVAEGQNVFMFTGTLMELDEPNEIIGILAHETGHMAAGHLVRSGAGMKAAMIPMLIGLVAGAAIMAAGGGDAGAAIIMGSQQIAERNFVQFTRTQESSADQAGIRYLNATHQSGEGMLKVFRRFQEQEILSDQHIDKFAMTHPSGADRIDALQALVDASPYHDVKDTPQAIYAYALVRAKLKGYIQDPQSVLFEYTDNSKPSRYARAMAYFRRPDMEKAQAEIDSLVRDEPNNPYFLEMQGQILVARGKVAEGIIPYRHAVHVLPDAPQIRVALAAAMIGTEDLHVAAQAQVELETALRQDDDDAFAWYELAQAFELQGMHGKAQLATAERYFKLEDYKQAMRFAYLAQQQLLRGSTDWQRAADIMTVAQTQTADQRR